MVVDDDDIRVETFSFPARIWISAVEELAFEGTSLGDRLPLETIQT